MRAFTIIIPLLVACDTTEPPDMDGGQFGEETGSGGCEVITSTPLADDEVTEFGFAAQEALDLLVGEHAATLTYNDGSVTDLTVTLADPGSAVLVDYEPEEDDSGVTDLMMICDDYVEIEMTLSLTTADGALAEVLSQTVKINNVASIPHFVALDGLSGTFAPEDWTSESFDAVSSELFIYFEEGGISGDIAGYGEASDEVTSSVSFFEIATF